MRRATEGIAEHNGATTPRAADVTAARLLSVPAARVFDFLSDLRNHWLLEDRLVELGGLDGDEGHGPTGGRVRIRGPLGVSREARTRVLAAEAPEGGNAGRLAGRADIGRATIGRVSWEIVPRGEASSLVTLAAVVERASVADRVLLALGGGWWLNRIFERTLATLAAILADSR